jgi:hypothetical protein
MNNKFDAAISFAGEQRKLARSIVRQLTPLGYDIYFDEYKINETLGEDLVEYFHKVFSKTKVIIMIVSKDYKKKPWTKLERKFAIENFILNKGKLFQIKIDATSLPGIPAQIHYYKYQDDLHELCSSISSVLGIKRTPQLNGEDSLVREIMESCFRRAIFTSMDNEISTEAMFKSIRSCIRELNRSLPKIQDGELSQYIKSVVRVLNEIDKFSSKKISVTMNFDEADKYEIDSLKINIVDKLHYLNNRYKTMIDIPDDIGFNYELGQFQFKD